MNVEEFKLNLFRKGKNFITTLFVNNTTKSIKKINTAINKFKTSDDVKWLEEAKNIILIAGNQFNLDVEILSLIEDVFIEEYNKKMFNTLLEECNVRK